MYSGLLHLFRGSLFLIRLEYYEEKKKSISIRMYLYSWYVKQFSVFTNRKTGTIKTHSAILCVERKTYRILCYYTHTSIL